MEQEERSELLSTLQQLPLKVRTEEQEAILQGLSPAEMGMHPGHLQLCVLGTPSTTQIWMQYIDCLQVESDCVHQHIPRHTSQLRH